MCILPRGRGTVMATEMISILDGSTFAVSNRAGDMDAGPDQPHGFFSFYRLAPSAGRAFSDIAAHVKNLQSATQILLAMIKDLRRGMDARTAQEHNSKLQDIEGEADQAVLDMLRRLYNGKQDPVQAMFLKDLFELLEKVTDRCRDAGNTITHIVLKSV